MALDVRKYIFGHCVHPIKLSLFDARTKTYVTRYVPCGKCLHCKNQHINEWTTRLYAHSLYVNNVYYITLDYAPFDETNETALQLAKETAAVHNDLNSTHHFGLHPILLYRPHLQNFLKRLRKNNPDKHFQYFACGEYGCAYKGHGFGRPHFHLIIFSNQQFTHEDFQSAWTLNRYKIGNVDFNDLRVNGTFDNNTTNKNKNPKFVFNYVCKYLQKNDFNFENMATIDYHRAYFMSLQKVCTNPDELFPKFENQTSNKVLQDAWQNYCKTYSPFCVSSKRPALGLQYFEEHKDRFKKSDFRLFGISCKNLAFPRYFLRKTKEDIVGFNAIGAVSEIPTSPSRIGYIADILREIQTTNLSIENWCENPKKIWCSDDYKIYFKYDGRIDKKEGIPLISLSFFDIKDRKYYFFTGDDYVIAKKVRKVGFQILEHLSIDNAIDLLDSHWFYYSDDFLTRMYEQSVFCENELKHNIHLLFPDCKDDIQDPLELRFKDYIYNEYKKILNNWNIKHKQISNTKNAF